MRVRVCVYMRVRVCVYMRVRVCVYMRESMCVCVWYTTTSWHNISPLIRALNREG